MVDGLLDGPQVYASRDVAASAMSEWLFSHDIHTVEEREKRSDWGTGIGLWECDIAGEAVEPVVDRAVEYAAARCGLLLRRNADRCDTLYGTFDPVDVQAVRTLISAARGSRP
jgi:hypothetical protein